MTELDTIVALATPRMTSALAIIRLSGSKTLSILEHIQKKKAENIIPNQSFFEFFDKIVLSVKRMEA